MTKRVPYHIAYACDKKFMIEKIFKNFSYVQNSLPQVCSHRICPMCSITFLADTNKNQKDKISPFCNDSCTEEIANKCNDVTTNHYNNFLAFFKVPQRNPLWSFYGQCMCSTNSNKSKEYLFQFRKNDRFLNLNLFQLFSKIVQQMKGESKEELEENWGGPEAFKLIIFLKDNFSAVVKQSPSILVFFSARWCAHCNQLRKPFGKAAQMAKEANLLVSFATLDVNLNADIADANDVVGIPTLKFYRDGKFISNYKGKRTAEDIFEFVKNPPRKATPEETLEL